VPTNITELGKASMCSAPELGAAGMHMVLYPVSAFRAMNKAAEAVFTDVDATALVCRSQ
jgi:methylisocitrate lyase